MKVSPSQLADKYVLRFERHGHRESLKSMAKRERRSLNSLLLLLIEAGERVLSAQPVNQGAQQ